MTLLFCDVLLDNLVHLGKDGTHPPNPYPINSKSDLQQEDRTCFMIERANNRNKFKLKLYEHSFKLHSRHIRQQMIQDWKMLYLNAISSFGMSEYKNRFDT